MLFQWQCQFTRSVSIIWQQP